jgi:hypothetical protein
VNNLRNKPSSGCFSGSFFIPVGPKAFFQGLCTCGVPLQTILGYGGLKSKIPIGV